MAKGGKVGKGNGGKKRKPAQEKQPLGPVATWNARVKQDTEGNVEGPDLKFLILPKRKIDTSRGPYWRIFKSFVQGRLCRHRDRPDHGQGIIYYALPQEVDIDGLDSIYFVHWQNGTMTLELVRGPSSPLILSTQFSRAASWVPPSLLLLQQHNWHKPPTFSIKRLMAEMSHKQEELANAWALLDNSDWYREVVAMRKLPKDGLQLRMLASADPRLLAAPYKDALEGEESDDEVMQEAAGAGPSQQQPHARKAAGGAAAAKLARRESASAAAKKQQPNLLISSPTATDAHVDASTGSASAGHGGEQDGGSSDDTAMVTASEGEPSLREEGMDLDEGQAAEVEELELEAMTAEALAQELEERYGYFDPLPQHSSELRSSKSWLTDTKYPRHLLKRPDDKPPSHAAASDPDQEYEVMFVLDEHEVKEGPKALRGMWYLIKYEDWQANPKFETVKGGCNPGDWMHHRDVPKRAPWMDLWKKYRPMWWLQQHKECGLKPWVEQK